MRMGQLSVNQYRCIFLGLFFGGISLALGDVIIFPKSPYTFGIIGFILSGVGILFNCIWLIKNHQRMEM